MVVIFSLCQGSLLAEPQNRLDVRTMADWSIVVAETAIASEKYAAEEFCDFFAQARTLKKAQRKYIQRLISPQP